MIDDHIRSFDELYARFGRTGFTDLRFPLADIDAFRWNRGEWNDAYYSYHYRRFTCHILSRLAAAPRQSILVVGCGFGFDEKNIRSLFEDAELWSIDVSLNMLSLALAGRSPSRFAMALAEKLPFPDACFDRVLSREVIEHVIDPAAMVREVARVLKPGGIAIITTENEESLSPVNRWDSGVRERLAGWLGLPMEAPLYKDDAPTVDEMRSMIERAGLELKEYFFDGALYKYLNEVSPLLKSRMVRAAHFFSRLENSRALAPLLCDQVKYVIRKPGDGLPAPCVVSYACIRCHGRLSLASGWWCNACGARYSMAGPVPDFVHASEDAAPSAPARGVEARSLRRFEAWAWRLIAVLRRVYCGLYLLGAVAGALFGRSNRGTASRLLAEGDPYRRFLRMP
jgi:ubiquinone/menaquinone biosynthesis C-methylase UbiE